MKNLKKLKINKVTKNELPNEQMVAITGGYCTAGSLCWCASTPPGGIQTSQTNSDFWYNMSHG